MLHARKVNMVSVVCQKSQYDKCCVSEKVNMISVVCIHHLSYWLFWHTTLIILTFLAHNTCYIAFSGTKHLSYWPFWHSTFTILTFLKRQYNKCYVPEKAIWYMLYARKFNMVSIVFQKSQYDKSCVPEKAI
jgi:hypothetical protein